MTDQLFDPGPPEVSLPSRGDLTPDVWRKVRQDRLIETGVHPMTRLPLRVGKETCGGCIYRIQRWGNSRRYPKCELAHISASAASDCRASWPACIKWEPK